MAVSEGTPIRLELRDLSKSFAGTRALTSVSLRVRSGEIHALIGQNGSGKSTLIKILSGYHVPDQGSVVIGGHPLRLPVHPGEARRVGLSFLHQDLGLAESMTIMENLRVGKYQVTRYGRLRWGAERAAAQRVLREIGLDLDPDLPIRKVPQAERALIGFARAIQDLDPNRGGVLILDEPTAFLPAPSVERLFHAIRAVARRGSAVIFVSHRLDEVLGISDRISVLRDGRLAGTVETGAVTEAALVSMMLGRELGRLYPTRTAAQLDRILGIEGLSGQLVRGLDLRMHRGEIVGLTGLVGMGYDEVPYLIYGARPASAGRIVLADGRATQHMTPAAAMKAGMALLPADRQHLSGIPHATVLENVTMPRLGQYFIGGRLRHRRERSAVYELLRLFDVRPPEPLRMLATLSGGNQQKALLAKWLQSRPAILLLHEPTQGVDIGSRKQIFSFIRAAADAGTAVLIASAEYEDLANLAHRVLILRRGRVVRELAGADLTEPNIVAQCYLSA